MECSFGKKNKLTKIILYLKTYLALVQFTKTAGLSL